MGDTLIEEDTVIKEDTLIEVKHILEAKSLEFDGLLGVRAPGRPKVWVTKGAGS